MMETKSLNPFYQYLAAKKALDDRSLNRHVYGLLARRLGKLPSDQPLTLFELGAGSGSMLARLIEWNLLRRAVYRALDGSPEFVPATDEFLQSWAQRWDFRYEVTGPSERRITRPGIEVELQLINRSLGDFLADDPQPNAHILLAHAFLDLVDLPSTLPRIVTLARPGGSLYFTLNFDGLTHFAPVLDPALDAQIEALYHASMDERRSDGRPSGDSRTGRHLLNHLVDLGCPILSAGSSDWVITPGAAGTSSDEVDFLNFILDTIDASLNTHPELDTSRLASWLEQRRGQARRGELIYIAHQLDVLAERPEH
jgi:hypothetical protein